MDESNKHNNTGVSAEPTTSPEIPEPSQAEAPTQGPATETTQQTNPQISKPDTSLDVTATIKASQKKVFSKKKLIIIVALVVLVLSGGVFALITLKEDKNLPAQNSESTETVQQNSETQIAVDPQLEKFITPTTGESWLEAHKKVTDLGFIKGYEAVDGGLSYYEVGARAGNTIYMVSVPGLGEVNYLFEKNPSGGVRFISQPNANFSYNEDSAKIEKEMLSTKVVFDNEIHYDSLSFPNKVTLKNGYSVRLGAYYSLGDRIDSIDSQLKQTLVDTFGGSKLELAENTYPDTALTSITYYLTLPTRTRVNLEYQPLNTDMSNYRFTTGVSTVKDSLLAITKGCGNLISSVSRADSIKDSDLKEVGVSGEGQKLYEAVSPDNSLVSKAFEEFKEFYSTDTDLYKKDMTKEEFIKNHSVIFFKDADNQWLVFAREEFRPAYGCAKPVVYLYPTYAQNVSVKVGADVKVSDPEYDPIAGWQNVWADPSGLLSYEGRDYRSLFWEGPGYGNYPAIKSGTIIKRADAVGTIRSQMIAQGFNPNEIQDFLDYWTPQLPNKPYVRLTWLTTQQMNALAPLAISPKPNTLIRTFLDFAGLDAPVDLPQQTFVKPQRTGFTVTEWGGLSQRKLY